GFRLPPDAPEVLEFYAKRSPIFLAAVFDADAAKARGQEIGDGIPVHVTIPTPNPWVPIRILALGKTGADQIDADVYLLTDEAPAFLPAPTGSKGRRPLHRGGPDRRRRLSPDRRGSSVPPGTDRLERHAPRSQREGDVLAARRPSL